MIKVGIINYGLGNIRSIIGAITYMGFDYIYSSDFKELDSCEVIVLPGVGAFPSGMKNLKQNKLDTYLCNHLKNRPLIGICLGMQLLFSTGYEFKTTKGLGLIEGEVVRFNPDSGLRVPNIGWDKLINHDFDFLEDEKFYFVHSYHVKPKDKSVITSESTFGMETFISSVQKENIYGFQFHPEKSAYAGILFLKKIITKSVKKNG